MPPLRHIRFCKLIRSFVNMIIPLVTTNPSNAEINVARLLDMAFSFLKIAGAAERIGGSPRSPHQLEFPGYTVRTATGNDARASEKLVTVAKNAPIRAVVLNFVISCLQGCGFHSDGGSSHRHEL